MEGHGPFHLLYRVAKAEIDYLIFNYKILLASFHKGGTTLLFPPLGKGGRGIFEF